MTSFDVGIIGGGVHGASAAFHLAGRGVSSVVLERGEAAGGPTGRSSAVCRAYYTNPFLARVARSSLDMLASFADHTGGRDAGFHRTGALFLHGPDDLPSVHEASVTMRAVGTAIEVLDAAAMWERFPRLNRDDLGCGAFEPDAGYADPVDTTVGLLARARELGVDVRLRTSVERIAHRGDDRGIDLHLGDGQVVTVGKLLIAAGPWTGALAAQLGVTLPLTIERHVVSTCSWGASDRLGFAFADVRKGYYARPELGGKLLIGPLTPEPTVDDPDEFDETLHEHEAVALLRKVVERVPSLDGLQPRGGWASLYDVSPDWQPVIGEIADGVYVDAGTSGHGFKLAPALGGYVADLVLGEPDPGLAAFSPARFADGVGLAAGYGDARILG